VGERERRERDRQFMKSESTGQQKFWVPSQLGA
jgi:hypothetical protein